MTSFRIVWMYHVVYNICLYVQCIWQFQISWTEFLRRTSQSWHSPRHLLTKKGLLKMLRFAISEFGFCWICIAIFFYNDSFVILFALLCAISWIYMFTVGCNLQNKNSQVTQRNQGIYHCIAGVFLRLGKTRVGVTW